MMMSFPLPRFSVSCCQTKHAKAEHLKQPFVVSQDSEAGLGVVGHVLPLGIAREAQNYLTHWLASGC